MIGLYTIKVGRAVSQKELEKVLHESGNSTVTTNRMKVPIEIIGSLEDLKKLSDLLKQMKKGAWRSLFLAASAISQPPYLVGQSLCGEAPVRSTLARLGTLNGHRSSEEAPKRVSMDTSIGDFTSCTSSEGGTIVGVSDGKSEYKCPECGRDAKFIGFDCEEVPMPALMERADLKRKPPFGELMRNFRVDCPKHGERIVQVTGHHITRIPKKSGKT